MDANLRTGGHILIEQLALHNADTVFGVPGESFLAALDGMYQSQRVRFINARHEGGAAMMADAYGKLTGRPGIAFATRGPGATNERNRFVLLWIPAFAGMSGARV